MTRTSTRAALALSLTAALMTAMPGARAQTATPPPLTGVAGAMPHDPTMTCEMIAAERVAIADAVSAKAAKKEKATKLRKGLFGFAKGMATAMVPGAALLGGGGSVLGSLAAQGAGQGAAQLMSDTVAAAPRAAPDAQPTAEQQARLTRLDTIGTFRRCAA